MFSHRWGNKNILATQRLPGSDLGRWVTLGHPSVLILAVLLKL